MTNTIPNVPRELLRDIETHLDNIAEFDPTYAPDTVPLNTSAELLIPLRTLLSAPSPAGHVEDVRAMVAATSPAGEDGLEVVAWLCEWMGDKCGGVYSGLSKTSLEGLIRSQGEDVLIVSDEPLCRLSDAAAIIDGLRGENHQRQRELRLRQSQIESSGRIAERAQRFAVQLRTERDQQAQRIGELEGLLLRVQVSLSLDDTEWGYSGAEKYKLLADIRAALSAGKEG